jgi:hypothetical protein
MTDTFSQAVKAMNNLNAQFYRHKVHNTLIRAAQIRAVDGLKCDLGDGNIVVVEDLDCPRVGDYLAVNLARNRYVVYDQALFFETHNCRS